MCACPIRCIWLYVSCISDADAKFYGSMMSLEAGQSHFALADLTGGVGDKVRAQIMGSCVSAVCPPWIALTSLNTNQPTAAQPTHSCQWDIADRRADIVSGAMWEELLSLHRDGHLLACGSHSGSDTQTNRYGIVQVRVA